MSTASEIKERSTGYFLEREIYPEILNKYSGNFYPEGMNQRPFIIVIMSTETC